jgi:hypothetical protein
MTDLDPSASWPEIRAAMIADMERERDREAEARAVPWRPGEARQEGRVYRRKSTARTSSVFTVRLDPGERDALERRAAMYGLPTSVLARNYIRMGLTTGEDAAPTGRSSGDGGRF